LGASDASALQGMAPKRAWTADQKRQVAAAHAWRCALCNELLNAAFEIDHITALENGGADDVRTNAQPLCSNCHAMKTQKERVQRIERARAHLLELNRSTEQDTHGTRARRSRTEVADLILDEENPFARFCYLPPASTRSFRAE
jgi:hypothetical protein